MIKKKLFSILILMIFIVGGLGIGFGATSIKIKDRGLMSNVYYTIGSNNEGKYIIDGSYSLSNKKYDTPQDALRALNNEIKIGYFDTVTLIKDNTEIPVKYNSNANTLTLTETPDIYEGKTYPELQEKQKDINNYMTSKIETSSASISPSTSYTATSYDDLITIINYQDGTSIEKTRAKEQLKTRLDTATNEYNSKCSGATKASSCDEQKAEIDKLKASLNIQTKSEVSPAETVTGAKATESKIKDEKAETSENTREEATTSDSKADVKTAETNLANAKKAKTDAENAFKTAKNDKEQATAKAELEKQEKMVKDAENNLVKAKANEIIRENIPSSNLGDCTKIKNDITNLEFYYKEILTESRNNNYEYLQGVIEHYNENKKKLEENRKTLDNPSADNIEDVQNLIKDGYAISQSGSQNLFGQYLINIKQTQAMCKDPNSENCKGYTKKQEDLNTLLNTLSAENFVSAISDQMNKCNAKDPNSVDCTDLNNALITKDCKSAFFSGLCTMFNFKSNEMLLEQETNQAIGKKIYGLETKNKDSINDAIGELLANSGIEGLTYNKENNKYSDNKNCESGCTLEQYRTHIENAINDEKTSPEDRDKLKIILAKVRPGDEQTVVTTNQWFFVMDAIKNPDNEALKTAKMFGFENDYSYLPTFLKETVPSQVCLDKIEGYMDKEIENNGGITTYGCTEYDIEADPKNKCLEVLGDLRAQRSEITPDNKTVITYSYYLKGQGSGNFKLSVKYVQNGNFVEYIIDEGGVTGKDLDKKESEKNQASVSKGYDSIILPLNNTEGIEPNSFTINLQAPNLDMTYPIVIISASTLSSTLQNNGNSAGNAQASSN